MCTMYMGAYFVIIHFLFLNSDSKFILYITDIL